MKKRIFRLLMLCMVTFTSSFFSTNNAAMLDGGEGFLVIGKTGTVKMVFEIPDQYLQMNNSLQLPAKISIFNGQNVLVYSVVNKGLVLFLEEASLGRGNYTVVFELGEIKHKQVIGL